MSATVQVDGSGAQRANRRGIVLLSTFGRRNNRPAQDAEERGRDTSRTAILRFPKNSYRHNPNCGRMSCTEQYQVRPRHQIGIT